VIFPHHHYFKKQSYDNATMSEESKELTLRFDSICELCEQKLPKGSKGVYFATRKKVQCLTHENITTVGEAGKSAQDKAEAIEAKYKENIESIKFIGKIIYPFLDPSKEAQKWAKGAKGERKVGKVLDEIALEHGFKVLHDRTIPKSKANIDHILVTPKGVFIIDAKNYKGKVEIRNDGGWFSTEKNKLIVDGRNRSKLVDGVKWQISRMGEELAKNNLAPNLVGVLGFVDAVWPFFGKPIEIDGVYLNSKGFTNIINNFNPSAGCDVEKTFFVIEKIFKSK
jgi:hypothetical protein